MTLSENTVIADIAVVGAGVSGVAAAIAAARAGARVALIERSSEIGGTMIAGLGFPVCGLFESNTAEPPQLLNQGLAAELAEAVLSENPQAIEAVGRVYILRCSAARFRTIYKEWLSRTPGIQLFSGMSGLDVAETGGRINSLQFQRPDNTPLRVEAAAVVDCTGNAAVVQHSSAERMVPDRPALAGFVIQVHRVEEADLLHLKVPYALRQAVGEGALPAFCRWSVYTPGIDGCGSCKISLPAETEFAEAMTLAQRMLDLLRTRLPAFRNVGVCGTSPAVLSREGVRLKGRAVLTADDVRTGRRFDDAIAHGGWPMEFWDRDHGIRYGYIKNGFSYDIPVRALRSVNIDNLWAAGRAVSADSDALASLRVIGTAIATGEAAGYAAAKEVL